MFKKLASYYFVCSALSCVATSQGSGPIKQDLVENRPAVPAVSAPESFISDPFLQAPSDSAVSVVWFASFKSGNAFVRYGSGLGKVAAAESQPLSRIKHVWRYEAKLSNLSWPGDSYQAVMTNSGGVALASGQYQAKPLPKIEDTFTALLTSDHQLKPMVSANIQKVHERYENIDVVFMAGDLMNVADAYNDWFQGPRDNSFFQVMQGKSNYGIAGTVYKGAPILQNAVIFPVIGNHEVMGIYAPAESTEWQYANKVPRAVVQAKYDAMVPAPEGTREAWVQDNSWNTVSYEEIFSLPDTSPGKETYYATSYGSVRLISLFAARNWEDPVGPDGVRSSYEESSEAVKDPSKRIYGQFIYGDIKKGSAQYNWLVQELQSPEFKSAKYKIVMMHESIQSIGQNIMPVYTDPVEELVKNSAGILTAIRYSYPLENNYLVRDIQPLLLNAGVHLVLGGHSHIWNRFKIGSVNFLESSHVGNTYSAWYNPNGLAPEAPTIENFNGLHFISSANHTVFSVFDSGDGTVKSYHANLLTPAAAPVLFDQFKIN